eukprot:2343428-Rhodomonas_salina.1
MGGGETPRPAPRLFSPPGLLSLPAVSSSPTLSGSALAWASILKLILVSAQSAPIRILSCPRRHQYYDIRQEKRDQNGFQGLVGKSQLDSVLSPTVDSLVVALRSLAESNEEPEEFCRVRPELGVGVEAARENGTHTSFNTAQLFKPSDHLFPRFFTESSSLASSSSGPASESPASSAVSQSSPTQTSSIATPAEYMCEAKLRARTRTQSCCRGLGGLAFTQLLR